MLQYLNQKRGQSTLEYAVLIVIIIGALLTIQVYIKRGMEGNWKKSADDIGDQFSPGNTNVIDHTHTASNSTETFGISAQGVSNYQLTSPEVTTMTTNSAIANVDQEYWGTNTAG